MADGFGSTYRERYGSVVAAAWSITRDRRTAEEHAQEAFARAYPRWQRLERAGYAVAWVHRVAINLAIDEVRRRSRHRSETPQHAPGVDGHVVDSLAVAERLTALPKRQREAVVLSVIADLPEVEVAALMGVSAGSVKTHKSRGLDRLRLALDQKEEVPHG